MPVFRQVEAHETLVFLHVPKAAGTSLRRIIKKHYPSSQRYHIYGRCQQKYDEFRTLPLKQKNRIRYIEGHMRFGIHEHTPQPCAYITFLRNPVERLISEYYYILTRPNHQLYDVVRKMSLHEFIDSEAARGTHNNQIQKITGKTPDELASFEKPEDILDLVRLNIENHFAFVGISEQFDTSLMLLNAAMGWMELPLYSRLNTTEGKATSDTIAEKTIERIRQINALDVCLYEEMTATFESLCEAMEGLGQDVSEFKAQNALFQERAMRQSLPMPIRRIGKYAKHLARHALRIKRTLL